MIRIAAVYKCDRCKREANGTVYVSYSFVMDDEEDCFTVGTIQESDMPTDWTETYNSHYCKDCSEWPKRS